LSVGHSDVRTIYNIYGHLMPGDEREAAVRLDAFLECHGGAREWGNVC
jgi:integrase